MDAAAVAGGGAVVAAVEDVAAEKGVAVAVAAEHGEGWSAGGVGEERAVAVHRTGGAV